MSGSPLLDAAHFILYVADQAAATDFYRAVLDLRPRLEVPGMTEFALPGGAVLGLMPRKGLAALLGLDTPEAGVGDARARAELYLLVADPRAYLDRAEAAGARPLSPLQPRDWGHEAGYVLDADHHVLAFAREVR